MAKAPRWYQQEAHDAFFRALLTPGAMPLLGIPTGAGKSFIIAMICKTLMTMASNVRIIMAVDSKELVKQNYDELIEYWPFAPVGIYCDGLGQKDATKLITFGTIQSMAGVPELFGVVTLMLVDEVQMISPAEETQYQKFIAALQTKNSKLIVGGLSATLFRSKGGWLIDHGLFNVVAYDITDTESFERLINEGYLVWLHSKPTNFFYDTSGIKTSGDDFNLKQLEASVNTREKNIAALSEAMQLGQGLNHWMVFCVGIKHVMAITHMLWSMKERAVAVHSKMSSGERDYHIQLFKTGKARQIVSDNILTKGFNDNKVDHLVFFRPRKAVVPHVQSLGRGTRPLYADGYDLDTIEGRLAAIEASGRPFCRVSDFGRNLERLGPINDPVIPGTKKKKGDMPIKICTTDKLVNGLPRGVAIGCGEYNFAAARICADCGEAFIFCDEPKIDDAASFAQAVKSAKPVALWIKVDAVDYTPFRLQNQAYTMRVVYKSGMNRYSELVSLDHEQPYVRHMARNWWRNRAMEPPATTLLGLMPELLKTVPVPTYVLVQLALKHPKIVDISFNAEAPELPEHIKEKNGQGS